MNRIYRKNMISVVLLLTLLFSHLTYVFALSNPNNETNTQTQEMPTTAAVSPMVIGETANFVGNEKKLVENKEGKLIKPNKNSYVSPKVSVSVIRKRVIEKEELRPIEVELSRTVEGRLTSIVDSQLLNATNQWSYTWSDQAALDPDGNPYIYNLNQKSEADLLPILIPKEIDENGNISFIIDDAVNFPTLDIQATKFWAGGSESLSPITLKLTKMIKGGLSETVDVVILDQANDWFKEWQKLPQFDPEGIDYYYDVSEINIPENFTSDSTRVVDEVGNITFIITISQPSPKILVTVNQSWIGEAQVGKPVKVMLTRRIVGEPAKIYKTTMISPGMNTSFSWFDLEKMDANGNLYIYELKEDGTADHLVFEVGSIIDKGGNLSFELTNLSTWCQSIK